MALPGLNIAFENGNLGTFTPSADAVFGHLIQMEPVGDIVANGCYLVQSFQDVVDLGLIDSVANHVAYKFFSEFYGETGPGADLYFMAIGTGDIYATIFGGATPLAKKLADFSQGKINGIFTVFNPSGAYTPTITDGIDANVAVLTAAAQTFCEAYITTNKAPMFAIIDGYMYNGTPTDLLDLNTLTNNRVGILLGDTEKRTGSTAAKGSAIGVLAGRLAAGAIQENPGKVRNGALAPLELFIVDEAVELANVTTLHDKGYITFRHHVGKSGYFFTDDPLATAATDDYKSLARRRIIDKAFRIVYATLLDDLLDDVNVMADGTINPIDAKSIEGRVISALYNQMAANGELSLDPANANDRGCIVKISLTHNVTSSNTLKFETLQVKPKGYLKNINVPIGFVPVTV